MSNTRRNAFPVQTPRRKSPRTTPVPDLGEMPEIPNPVPGIFDKPAPYAASARLPTHDGHSKPGSLIHPAIGIVHRDPDQPRDDVGAEEDREDLTVMAGGMKERIARGELPFIQLPTVRQHPTNPAELMIVTGGRRYEAAVIAGLATFPSVMVQGGEDPLAQLVENVQRKDLSPKQEARAIRKLIDERGMTIQDVTRIVRANRDQVRFLLALLALPAPIDALYESGRCRVPRILANLARAFEIDADTTTIFCEAEEEITRGGVDALLRRLREGDAADGDPDPEAWGEAEEEDPGDPGTGIDGGAPDRGRADGGGRRAGTTVRLDGGRVRLVRLVGTAWVETGDGETVEVDAAALGLDAS